MVHDTSPSTSDIYPRWSKRNVIFPTWFRKFWLLARVAFDDIVRRQGALRQQVKTDPAGEMRSSHLAAALLDPGHRSERKQAKAGSKGYHQSSHQREALHRELPVGSTQPSRARHERDSMTSRSAGFELPLGIKELSEVTGFMPVRNFVRVNRKSGNNPGISMAHGGGSGRQTGFRSSPLSSAKPVENQGFSGARHWHYPLQSARIQ